MGTITPTSTTSTTDKQTN